MGRLAHRWTWLLRDDRPPERIHHRLRAYDTPTFSLCGTVRRQGPGYRLCRLDRAFHRPARPLYDQRRQRHEPQLPESAGLPEQITFAEREHKSKGRHRAAPLICALSPDLTLTLLSSY